MPVVELLVIDALEARAGQAKHLYVIGRCRSQDMFGDLGAVWHAIGHHLLASQGGG
jgi:hypothetical protein